MNRQLSKVVDRAHERCSKTGGKLTEKRKRILEILLLSNTPLSAYEIADVYSKHFDQSMPPMSVYRILDFLESEQLVHKLNSANKYVACSHIDCEHSHQVPQFLICGHCQCVNEITISKSIVAELEKQIERAGYKLVNSHLELQCVCQQCSGDAT